MFSAHVVVASGPQLNAPSWQMGRRPGTGNPFTPQQTGSVGPHATELTQHVPPPSQR
jgi:hypothetical protein